MRTMRKCLLLFGLAALLAVTTLGPVARADEPSFTEKTEYQGNRGRYYYGGGRGGRGGRYYYGGGSGWGWAAFGATVGLGVLAAVNQPKTVYVQPAPPVVYQAPPTYYYYPAPGYTVVPQTVVPYSGGQVYYYYR